MEGIPVPLTTCPDEQACGSSHWRCRIRALDDIDIAYCGLEALRQQAEAREGRPVAVLPLTPEQSILLGGLGLSTPMEHVVYYPVLTSQVHRDHIVLRELLRIIVQGNVGLTEANRQLLMPRLPPELVDNVLQVPEAPVSADDAEEVVEVLTTLIGERAVRATLTELPPPEQVIKDLEPLRRDLAPESRRPDFGELATPAVLLYQQVIDIHQAMLALRRDAPHRCRQARALAHSPAIAEAYEEAVRWTLRHDLHDRWDYAEEVRRLLRTAASYQEFQRLLDVDSA